MINIWDKVFKSGVSKGSLPQNLFTPLLNTLSHIISQQSIECLNNQLRKRLDFFKNVNRCLWYILNFELPLYLVGFS